MSNIAIKGATTGTGVFTLESPATNTDRTLVLPDEAGTVLTSAGVPASAMPAGSVIQVVEQRSSTDVSTTSGSPQTIVSASITPSSASNKIVIYAVVGEPDQGDGRILTRVFRNTTSTEVFRITSEVGRGLPSGTEIHLPNLVSFGSDLPNTTSATTYFIGINSQTGGAVRVGNGADHVLILMEIAG